MANPTSSVLASPEGEPKMEDLATWAFTESRWADFGDGRLNQRFTSIMMDLAKHPEGSIPQATGSWKATKGAYRFFDNPRVTPQGIVAAERDATVQRSSDQDVLLAVQDPCTLNFSGLVEAEGLGPIGASEAKGLFLHSVQAVRTDGVPLGTLNIEFWARSEEKKANQGKESLGLLLPRSQGRLNHKLRNASPLMPCCLNDDGQILRCHHDRKNLPLGRNLPIHLSFLQIGAWRPGPKLGRTLRMGVIRGLGVLPRAGPFPLDHDVPSPSD